MTITKRETKSDICRRIKMHRAQLDTMLAKAGAPSPDKQKKYSVREVAAFIAASRGDSSLDTLRTARLREVQLRCTKLERELARDDGEVVSVAEMSDILARVHRRGFSRMRFLLETEKPGQLAGLDAGEIRRRLRDAGDDIQTTFKTEWLKELPQLKESAT